MEFFDTFDQRIPQSLDLAKEGMDVTFVEEAAITDHPNTARIKMSDGLKEIEVVGISIGGGKIQITELNGFELFSMNQLFSLCIMTDLVPFATVTNILMKHSINIGHMEVSRKRARRSSAHGESKWIRISKMM